MMRRKTRNYSRLNRRERKKYARQTFLFTLLTVLLAVAVIFWGIPSLIKMAVFLGDIRSSSQPITGSDDVAPSPPIIHSLPDATNSAYLRIEGFAEEGSTVVLSLNGRSEAETIVESDGEFLFNKVALNEGNNLIFTKAVDLAGNESQPSTKYSVNFDNLSPPLEISTPADNSTYYGDRERDLRIEGKSDPDASVSINESLAILSQDGSFSYPFSLSGGENIITISSKDRAGNESKVNLTIYFEE